MGLDVFEGFEANRTQAAFLRQYPGSVNIPSSFPSEPGRLGGYCLRHNGTNPSPIILLSHDQYASSMYSIGFGIKMSGANPGQFNIVTIHNSTGNKVFELGIYVLSGETGFRLIAKRYLEDGSTSFSEFQSTDFLLVFGVWHHIELLLPLRQGFSGAILKINGDTVVYSIGPRQGVGHGFNSTEFKLVSGSSHYILIDDLYVSTGPDAELYGQNAQVTSIFPKLDKYNEWEDDGQYPNGHFNYVDEGIQGDVDDDLSYVSGLLPGTFDAYEYTSPLGIRGNILGVKLSSDVRSDTDSDIPVEQIIRDTIVARISALSSTTYNRKHTVFTEDPITGKKWIVDHFHKLIAGLKMEGKKTSTGTVLYIKDSAEKDVYIVLDGDNRLPILSDGLYLYADNVNDTYFPVLLENGSTVKLPFVASAIEAGWRAQNLGSTPAIFNVHYRSDGGFLTAPDEGETYIVQNPRSLYIDFSSPIITGAQVVLADAPGTDAIEGTHYQIIGGRTRNIAGGQTEHQVQIQILNSASWHKAKRLGLYLESSVGADLTGQREFRFYIYKTTPPAIQFSDNAIEVTTAKAYNVALLQNITSLETTKIYLRVKGTGGNWILNTHYTWSVGDIIPGTTSAFLIVNILPQALIDFGSGDAITFYIDHEPSDGSGASFWHFTHDWLIEGTEFEGQQDKFVDEFKYAGEATTHISAGGQNAQGFTNAVGWFELSQDYMGITNKIPHPDGGYMKAVIAAGYLQGNSTDFYTRESFFLEDWCGGPGRKQYFKKYMFMSQYVHEFQEVGVYKNSFFMGMNFRNRAPADTEFGAVFQRAKTQQEASRGVFNQVMEFYHNGVLMTTPVFIDGSWYYPWWRERISEESILGIEEEVDPVTGETYVRFWCLVILNNTDFFENNAARISPPISGTATGGSNTTLIDTSKNFSSLRVGAGDVVANMTDGCYSYVQSVSGNTLTLKPLHDGLSNSFAAGNAYEVYRNYRGLVTDVTDIPGFGIKLTCTTLPVPGDFTVSGVGKLQEIVNLSTGHIGTIDFNLTQEDDFGEPGVGPNYVYMKGELASNWSVGNSYEVRNRSTQPIYNSHWSGNAIYRFAHCQTNEGKNGQISSINRMQTAKNKGFLAMSPQYIAKDTEVEILRNKKPDPFYGYEDPEIVDISSRFRECRRVWWEPRGNATFLVGGIRSCSFILQ